MATKAQKKRGGFGCPLCKQELERRTDKNQKPYFVCDDCGTQFFVRRPAGIHRLEALLNAPEVKPDAIKIPARIATAVLFQLDALDDATGILDEADEFGEPGSDDMESALPLPEWIQARTASVRSLLNLK
jgi:hypothetical protein